MDFYPWFFQIRAFRTLHPPKQYVFLEFLIENKALHFSKRALRVDTARNKWLKKPWLLKSCCIHRKHGTTSKYFRTSRIHFAMLPISRSITLWFFVASDFIVICPIKLFQKDISIIRSSVSAAIRSALPPVQAWSRTVEKTILLAWPAHLTTVWCSASNWTASKSMGFSL